jgi:hypothetical protein
MRETGRSESGLEMDERHGELYTLQTAGSFAAGILRPE